MTSPVFRLGSRGSALALWQTEHVAARLKAADPGLTVEIEVIKTSGDKILDVPLARIGDRGLFVKEIEEALLAGRIDAAVHSLKDLPTAQPAGLAIAAVLERVDPSDALVSAHGQKLVDLPAGAIIGSSSLRRRAQLAAAYPHLQFRDVRGNLQTRLAKLDAGEYDALVLAAAGLDRLDLDGRITERIDGAICLPAVGQAALAVECQAADQAVIARLAVLEHPPTRMCVTAERALLAALEGGCQVPIAANCEREMDTLVLRARVASLDGRQLLEVIEKGASRDPIELGQRAAAALLAQGADQILASVRANHS